MSSAFPPHSKLVAYLRDSGANPDHLEDAVEIARDDDALEETGEI